ncbi:MAG: hypothetical protein HC852_11025 [Acaryochloridaceae cyanobacterium RU_4_10]|nr:hypothetical protein [Acaryochloridaceae cyanobacterium RU_4_10]
MKINYPIAIVTLSSIFASGILGYASWSLLREEMKPTYAVQSPLRKAYDRCYPSTRGRPVEEEKVDFDGATYWEIRTKPLPGKHKSDFVHLKTAQNECTWLNRNRSTFRLDYLPKSVALEFPKQRYKSLSDRCIEAAKKLKAKDPQKSCITYLENFFSGSEIEPTIFFPEEVEALSDLGVNPNQIKNWKLIKDSSQL